MDCKQPKLTDKENEYQFSIATKSADTGISMGTDCDAGALSGGTANRFVKQSVQGT